MDDSFARDWRAEHRRVKVGHTMDEFFKFPSTPHLAVLGGRDVRYDKVMSRAEREEFLRHELVVEEKMDGANLGISFDSQGELRAQNRGSFIELPGAGQWRLLGDWLAPRMDLLFEHLTDRYILFGEWCYARHSVGYDLLPDWFLGFDVYDVEAQRFLSTTRRDAFFDKLGVVKVPEIARGRFTLAELTRMLRTSRCGNEPAEGLYLRRDEGDWLFARAKLVRPEFIQAIEEHWTRSGIQPNRLKVV